MDAGIHPEEFWELSIREIRDIIDSKARIREKQLKERIIVANYAVLDLSYRIAAMLPGGDKLEERHLWDYFPWLYGEEKQGYQEYMQREELEQFKERRKQYAARHNRKWTAGHGSEE